MKPTELNAEPVAELVRTMRYLDAAGLNTGSAGNASCRAGPENYWITPTGVLPGALTIESCVAMSLRNPEPEPTSRPSSEWRMHQGIYRARPEIRAIVHTHSSYATALACTGKSLPAFHYMVAIAGGDSIPCAPYATFGTQELSDHAVSALNGRRACLLANHGALALGATPTAAVRLAIEVEELAKQYCIAKQQGDPVILDEQQMREVLKKFETYGQ
ncbi:MAG: class II aldolase/adducin family protein [Gammaproteobacteria bacterium]|jgi:L-fuculose-phosphate aldolase|nr:class II aldolase/adducin family protein [Gammaproteobacteria bacterium]